MALTLEDADRAIDAARAAGVALQVGFNRRFAARLRRHARPDRRRRDRHAATAAVAHPRPGHLRRCRRPGEAVDDLQRDADPRLRHAVLAQSGRPRDPGVRTGRRADPSAVRRQRFLDTSVVQIRFDNGAFAIAEASFQAVYGYDVRGEVFGSGGVLQAGRAPEQRGHAPTSSCSPTPTWRSSPTSSTACTPASSRR